MAIMERCINWNLSKARTKKLKGCTRIDEWDDGKVQVSWG